VLHPFDYARKLMGAEYLAVGSDRDVVGNADPIGGGFQPSSQPNFARFGFNTPANGQVAVGGLAHPKRMFDVTDGLIRRGYNDADIRMMIGGNAVRVLSAIWPPAAKNS
jgi:membrane dipeptidase